MREAGLALLMPRQRLWSSNRCSRGASGGFTGGVSAAVLRRMKIIR